MTVWADRPQVFSRVYLIFFPELGYGYQMVDMNEPSTDVAKDFFKIKPTNAANRWIGLQAVRSRLVVSFIPVHVNRDPFALRQSFGCFFGRCSIGSDWM